MSDCEEDDDDDDHDIGGGDNDDDTKPPIFFLVVMLHGWSAVINMDEYSDLLYLSTHYECWNAD